jgi:hypothetical protein
MPRPPKDGAEWNLHVQRVTYELFWPLHKAANSAEKEFGEWVLSVLKKAAEEELGIKLPKRGKLKTSASSRASSDSDD